MELAEIIKANAEYVISSGVAVHCDTSYSTVSIEDGEGNCVFLQGNEADTFNDECWRLWNQVQTLGIDTVRLSEAYAYIHLLGE